MKHIIACFAFVLSLQVMADEIKFATATSDAINETTVFYLDVNTDGSVQAMRYVTTLESGRISEDVHATVEEVLHGGVVIQEMEGREIVRLFLENFDVNKGGDIRLQYLANGVTGSKGNHMLRLAKKGGAFVLTDSKSNSINTMFIKGNWSRILRRYIGVSSIETSFELKNK